MSAPTKPNNRLLAALAKKTYQLLRPTLESFDLKYKDIIYDPGDTIKYAYFPETGIISLLSTVDYNSTLEVGIVGSEGMIGLPLFLGEKRSDTRALVQGSGMALRITARDFLAECSRSDELPRILRRFTHSLMKQISQSAACNRFHAVEFRLARWLLMTHDRMKNDRFQITQEFLSNMIGVRREAVTKAAGNFQTNHLISYHRGDLTIEDRERLESLACSCYVPPEAR